MSEPGEGPGWISHQDRQRFIAALQQVSPRQGRLDRFLRSACRLGFRLVGWRLESDLEKLPARPRPGAGCVIAAAPHRAWVEPFLLYVAWPSDGARLVWLADGRAVGNSWWRRRLLPRLGIVPIDGSPRSLPIYVELAAEVLGRGMALVVFPETGPPSPPDRTRRISAGFAYLAASAGAPVVPVVVAGTHHIVRGSSFSLVGLEALEIERDEGGPADASSRGRAHAMRDSYIDALSSALPACNAGTDARRPTRDRWRWLGTLFG